MKKALIIISAIMIISFWLVDCRVKGEDDLAMEYFFHRTPSPSVTITVTATPTPG